jgi:hypothetical protein
MIQTSDWRTHTQISALLLPDTNPPPALLVLPLLRTCLQTDDLDCRSRFFFAFLPHQTALKKIRQTVRNSYEQIANFTKARKVYDSHRELDRNWNCKVKLSTLQDQPTHKQTLCSSSSQASFAPSSMIGVTTSTTTTITKQGSQQSNVWSTQRLSLRQQSRTTTTQV